MRRILFVLLITICLSVFSNAQVFLSQNVSIDEQKLDKLAHAIAAAEGFGTRNTIPTRFHNPGDIRSSKNHHYPGQVGLATKNHYVVFKNDAAGFDALKTLVRKIASGRMRPYGTNPTILRVSKSYATGWKVWSKNVSARLGVSSSILLRDYLREDEPVIPSFVLVEVKIPVLFSVPPPPVLAVL